MGKKVKGKEGILSWFGFKKKKVVKAPTVQPTKEFLLWGLTKRDLFWIAVIIFILLTVIIATYVTHDASLLMKTKLQLSLIEQLKLYQAQNPDSLVLLDPEYLRNLPTKKDFSTDLWENYKSWLKMVKDLLMSWLSNMERTMRPDSFVKSIYLEENKEFDDFVSTVKEYLENVTKK